MCLKVPSDNLDTWVATMLFNLALGKQRHFHATTANDFNWAHKHKKVYSIVLNKR